MIILSIWHAYVIPHDYHMQHAPVTQSIYYSVCVRACAVRGGVIALGWLFKNPTSVCELHSKSLEIKCVFAWPLSNQTTPLDLYTIPRLTRMIVNVVMIS